MKTILYVEDDEDDLMLFREALPKVDANIKLVEQCEGKETWDYLVANVDNLPSLIILDLNMPGMNGQELLKKISEDERFSSIPIVVFTTSEYYFDMEYCKKYTEHYIKKPMEFEGLVREVTNIINMYKINQSA